MSIQSMIFTNTNFCLRVIIDENYEPYFVAKEVARQLGFKYTQDTVLRHIDNRFKIKVNALRTDENSVSLWWKGLGPTQVLIRTPSLYILSAKSKDIRKARDFQYWIYKDVSPRIQQMKQENFEIEEILKNPPSVNRLVKMEPVNILNIDDEEKTDLLSIEVLENSQEIFDAYNAPFTPKEMVLDGEFLQGELRGKGDWARGFRIARDMME